MAPFPVGDPVTIIIIWWQQVESAEIVDAEDGTGADEDTTIDSIQELCVAAIKGGRSAEGKITNSVEAEESVWNTIVGEVKRTTQANRSRILAAKAAELLCAIWKNCGPMPAQSRSLNDLFHFMCGVLLILAPQPVKGKSLAFSKECTGITGDTARAMRQRLLEMIEIYVLKHMRESGEADIEIGSLMALSAIGVSPFPTPIEASTCSAGGLYLASLPMHDRLCALRTMEGLLGEFVYGVNPERLNAFAWGVSSFLSVERSPQCIIPCLKVAQHLLCDKRLGESAKSELFDAAGSFFPVALAGNNDEIQASEEAIQLQADLIAELERTLTTSVEIANLFRATVMESLIDQSWERASQGWSLVGKMAFKYSEACQLGLENLLDLTRSALRGLDSRRLPDIGEVLATVCKGALASREEELLQGLMSQCYEIESDNWHDLAGLCTPVAKHIASSQGTGRAFAAIFSNLEQLLKLEGATEKHMLAFKILDAILGYPRDKSTSCQDLSLLSDRLSHYCQASLNGHLESGAIKDSQEMIFACLAGIALLPAEGGCYEPAVNLLIDILRHERAPSSAVAAFESFTRMLTLATHSKPELEIPSQLFDCQDAVDMAAVISKYGPYKIRGSALMQLVSKVADSRGSTRIKLLLVLSRYSLASEEAVLVDPLSESIAHVVKVLLSIENYSQAESIALIECVCSCVRFIHGTRAVLEELRLHIWELVVKPKPQDLGDVNLVATLAALSALGRSVATNEDVERLYRLLECKPEVEDSQFGKIHSTVVQSFQSAASSVLTTIPVIGGLENFEKSQPIRPLALLRAARIVAISGDNPEPIIRMAVERVCQGGATGIDEICCAVALSLSGSNQKSKSMQCEGFLWALTSYDERSRRLQLQHYAMSLFSVLDQVVHSSGSASILQLDIFCAFCTLVMCFAPESALRLLRPNLLVKMAPISSRGICSISHVGEFPDDAVVLTKVITTIVERTRWTSAEVADDILSALLQFIVQGKARKESVVIAAVTALTDLMKKSTIRRHTSEDEIPYSWISGRRHKISDAMRSLLDDERRSVRTCAVEGLAQWENQ